MKTRSNKISPSAKFIHFLVYGCILDVTISISIAVSVTANYKSVELNNKNLLHTYS